MNATIYQKTISNDYLGVMEEVKGTTLAEIKVKAKKQLARWAKQERRQRERADLDDLKELADYDTLRAEEFLEECGSILRANLDAGRKLDWVSLFDDEPFPPFVFKEPVPRYEPIAKEMGVPKKSFFAELLIPSVKTRRVNSENEAKQALDKRLRQYEERKESARAAHEEQRAAYLEEQSEYNRSVDELQLDFEKGRPEAIESFARIALAKLTYPDLLEVEFDAQYDQDKKLIIINCVLPVPGEIPRTIRYNYHEEEHGITALEMGQKDFDDFYESVLLQITLGSIHVIFESLNSRHVQRVGLNGRVKDGELESCILTCKVSRDVFESCDLAKIPLKECFLGIKGVMAEPLTGLTPVRPIVNRKRTPSLYSETERISTEVNPSPKPAAYRPGDFKHLAKEIVTDMFEQIENDLVNIDRGKKTRRH